MGKAKNKANRSAAAPDPEKRGETLVSKESMKANAELHNAEINASTSEDEDQDLAKVMSGEDIKTAPAGGFYTFRSREDCVKGFYVGEVHIKAKFSGNTFLLTDAVAEGYGLTAKEIAMAMIKRDRRHTEYMLVSGPNVVQTEAMIKADKVAQVASNRRASQVLQGPRSTGRGDSGA